MYLGDSPGCGCNTMPDHQIAVDVSTAYDMLDASGNEPYPVLQGFGAAMPVATGAAKGAAGGAALGPWGAAAGAVIGAAAGLFSKKPQHMSPWGFHVDDYAAHILDAERQIVTLRGQLAQAMGQQPPQYPMYPWPPATPGAFSGATAQAWYDAMRPVVAQYSAQADCVTNANQVQPGGCYEQTYSQQLSLLQQLKGQLAQLGISAGLTSAFPASGSAVVSPMNPLTNISPYQQFPGVQSPFTPSPLPLPSPFSSGGGGPGPSAMPYGGGQQSVFAGGMNNWLLIGAGAIAFFMIISAQRNAPMPEKKPAPKR